MVTKWVIKAVCLASFAAGFATHPSVLRPGMMAASPGLTKPDQASTSLHVGVSYGPPMGTLENGQQGWGVPRNNQKCRCTINNEWQSCCNDMDPAFTSAPTTLAIALCPTADEEALQRGRNVKRSLAGATAMVCATLLTKQFLPKLLVNLPFFYQAHPLQAPIASCGLNSALADTISQLLSWKQQAGADTFHFESKRSLSSVVYGAFCLGVGSNLMHTKTLPALFPGSGLGAILSQTCLDNFICAPLLWLPPAHMIKALFHRQSAMESLTNYAKDVRERKLLLRCWCVWLPAQGITFGMVPKHLRVVSTAIFSFVWFLILTSLSAKKNDS